jgi:DNA-binding transcriptional ArsR family regulator
MAAMEGNMLTTDHTTLESLFLALADKTRLRLLDLMSDGEVSVGYLADQLGESQPKISRHLAYLRGAGLVSTRRDGKWIYYGIEQQENAGAEDVLGAALAAMRGSNGKKSISDVSATQMDQRALDTYEEAYLSDWAPAELEIFLL